MIKTFREQYQEDKGLQKRLADGWGYNLKKTPLDFQDKKQATNVIPVVANITLRNFGNEIIKSQRIQQVEDEIRALQNERMLMQLRQVKQESSINQKSEVIILMEKLIQDYNEIVEHKHLISKVNEVKPQVLDTPTKQESDSEALLNKINAQKAQLLRGDLDDQIRLNKQIAKTYRRYKLKVENIPTNNSLKKNQSIARAASISFRKLNKYQSETYQKGLLSASPNPRRIFLLKISDSDGKLQKSSQKQKIRNIFQNEGQVIDKFKNLQLKKYFNAKKKQQFSNQLQKSNISMPYISRLSQKRGMSPQRRHQKIVELPFMSQQQIEDFRLMQNKVKDGKEALEHWKGKINDFYGVQGLIEKRQAEQKLREKTKMQQQSRMFYRQIEIEKNIQKQVKIIEITAQKKDAKRKQEKQAQVNKLQKQSIFAELLRKRNSKFGRLWGTRILVKYDPVAQAKSLLKGQAEKSPNAAPQSIHTSPIKQEGELHSQIRHTSIEESKLTPGSDGGEGRNISVWKEQRGDQEHYWRMCKNEKINLLLKRR